MKRGAVQSTQFTPLPLGSIRPKGWLARQLRIQAEGLSGHLDEFWPDIKDSGWFGGTAEAWERAPYWLDGVVPLAYLLNDQRLTEKVSRHIDFIVTHQQPDGWLGPVSSDMARYDLWGEILIFKPLLQYYEATGDARIPAVIEKALLRLDRHIDMAPLFNWGQFRWFEALIPIYWLYERTGADWLVDLAVKLHAQGFNWEAFFQRWPITQSTPKKRWNYMGHVVNNAMAIKSAGLWQRISGDARALAHTQEMIQKLDLYHGMVTGVFTGDECLAGKSPTQGTELCAVVEYAYSLETLLSIYGEASFGDRLEKIIFNALPATFSPDMWSHQYDQQVNQVECSIRDDRYWVDNGPESNLFGLEPNYGCCTANLSQGWPKFAAHLWMRTQDGGLAAVAYAPCQVETLVEGTPVRITVDTDYPFRDEIQITVEVEQSVIFPIELRIPAWAQNATMLVNGEAIYNIQPGRFLRIEREWTGSSQVTLTLPAKYVLRRGYNAAVALVRGPLVFSLPIGEEWRQVNQQKPHRELPHADWEIYPTTSWNYALELTGSELEEEIGLERCEVGEYPFSPAGAPVHIKVPGRRLEGWGMEHGCAQAAPLPPVHSEQPVEVLKLIPYGCTNLRITEFPIV